MALDDRPMFEQLCRINGTRCDRIMSAIEAGAPNEYIADRFKTTPDVIEVYRRAYYDRLTPINHNVTPNTEL